MNEEPTNFTIETALGTIAVTASNEGLLSLVLPTRCFSGPRLDSPFEFAELVDNLKAYFDGRKVCFDNIKLDLSSATPFQSKVWKATRSIPYGETRSYRWVAEQIGKPGAYRAVGQALGKNPLPIIIPCHRVIASDRSFGGYSGGREMKQHLLNLELTSASTKPGL
jgi:methylated-DNA-[protein]-cysteine S-methyltransferase